MSFTGDFSREKLLSLDVERCDFELLSEAVKWAQLNAPILPEGQSQDVGRVLERIGTRFRFADSFQTAAEIFEVALSWCDQLDMRFAAVCCASLGSMLAAIHQWDRSIEVQLRGLEMFRVLVRPAPLGVVGLSLNLGKTFRKMRRYEDAEKYLRAALDYVPAAQRDPKSQGADAAALELKLQIGLVAAERGRAAEAIDIFEEVTELAFAAGKAVLLLMACDGYAKAAVVLRRHEESLGKSELAIENVLKPSLSGGGEPRFHLEELMRAAGHRITSLTALSRHDETQTALNEVRGLVEEYGNERWDLLARYWGWHAKLCQQLKRQNERLEALAEALSCAQRCEPINKELERSCTLDLVFGLLDANQTKEVDITIKAALERPANHEDPRQVAFLEGNLALARDLRGDFEGALESARHSLNYFLSDRSRFDEDAANCVRIIFRIYATGVGRGQTEAFLKHVKARFSRRSSADSIRQLLDFNKMLAGCYEKLSIGADDQNESLNGQLFAIVKENQRLSAEYGEVDNDPDYVRWLRLSGHLAEPKRTLMNQAKELAEQDADRFVDEVVDVALALQRENRKDEAIDLFLHASELALRFTQVSYKPPLTAALLKTGRPDLAETLASHLPESAKAQICPDAWRVHQRLAAAYDSDHGVEAIREIDFALRAYTDSDQSAWLRLNLDRRRRFVSLIETAVARADNAEAWRLAEAMTRSANIFDTLAVDAARFFGKHAERASVVCYYSLHHKVLIVTFRPATGDIYVHISEPVAVISQSIFALYDQTFNEILTIFRQMESLGQSLNLGRVVVDDYERQGWELEARLDELLTWTKTTDYLAALYKYLILPVENEFRSDRLIALVTDSFLATVPFYALYDENEGNYLIDKGADLFLLPSLTHIREALLRRKPRLVREGLLVVPEPTLLSMRRRSSPEFFQESDQGLGAKSKEIEAVKRFGRVRALTGKDANLRNIEENMAEMGFVHFLSHGVTDFESPEEAAIILAGGERLRGAFLGQCRSELLWMVVLGSCYGASSRNSYTSERGASLASELIRHGVPIVIGSLWFVDTCATERIMSSFYDGLGRELEQSDNADLNVAGAFRRALLETRSDFPHVYYWGLFYPLGDFCPSIIPPSDSNLAHILFGRPSLPALECLQVSSC
jgi:CHAT domain-containing protein